MLRPGPGYVVRRLFKGSLRGIGRRLVYNDLGNPAAPLKGKAALSI
jgi:hypothetical protein